jgi:hypothetical protein
VRSPSTLRRLLAAAERDVAAATAERDRLASSLATAGVDHAELARLGHGLTAAETRVAHAEDAWLRLAAEAEAAGLTL